MQNQVIGTRPATQQPSVSSSLSARLAQLLSPRAGATPAFQAARFGIIRRSMRSRAQMEGARERLSEINDCIVGLKGALGCLHLSPSQITYLSLVIDRWHVSLSRMPEARLSQVPFCVALPARDVEDLVTGLRASTITAVRRTLQERGLIHCCGDKIDFSGLRDAARSIEACRDHDDLAEQLQNQPGDAISPSISSGWSKAPSTHHQDQKPTNFKRVPDSATLQGVKKQRFESYKNTTETDSCSVSVFSKVKFEEITDLSPKLVAAFEAAGHKWEQFSSVEEVIKLIPEIIGTVLPQSPNAERVRPVRTIWDEACRNFGNMALDGLIAALAPSTLNPGGFFAAFASRRLSHRGITDLEPNLARLRQEAAVRLSAETAKARSAERQARKADLPALVRKVEDHLQINLRRHMPDLGAEAAAALNGRVYLDVSPKGNIDVLLSAPNGFKYRPQMLNIAGMVRRFVDEIGITVAMRTGSGSHPLNITGNAARN